MLQLEQARGPSAAARTNLGSCRLENCTFGKLLIGKLPLGKRPLGKNLTFKNTMAGHGSTCSSRFFNG